VTVSQGRGDVVDRVLDAVWRMESPRLIAALTRIVRDVGIAEDLAQDAFVAAVQQWPVDGVPDNPAAWLTAVGKRRAVDHIRRSALARRKHDELGRDLSIDEEVPPDAVEERIDASAIGDDLLRLAFICCHPVLSVDARVTLTLRLLGGLRADEIARAFLTTETTIQQRIVRAKRTLTEAHVPFEVPRGADFAGRLGSVLQVIYLVFNEGYSATAGEDWVRPALCEDALRLGRVLATLVPDEPEVHGLVALMEIQASRIRARVGPGGEPIPLLEQNRARWDRILIQRGLAALDRAEGLGGGPGPYTLQAAIAACHARARTAGATDWERIVALYDALAQLMPSPIVELNRAVAVGMAFGPDAGLDIVDGLIGEPALASYHLLPAVRADLLEKLGRFEESAAEFARAASLTRNVPEQTLLLRRASEAAERLSAARRVLRTVADAGTPRSTS
jgi:RNA polymerase sigma factor (sigma-70 family)